MRRILFVDDEPNILQALQRMLRPMRDEWSMTFAEGGRAALDVMAGQEFDVVVSDLRMPCVSGVDLFEEVRIRWPRVVRIILTGQGDTESMLKLVELAHQCLLKPCDAISLKSAIDGAANE
jgi:DNA-binding NtrC family response regulator